MKKSLLGLKAFARFITSSRKNAKISATHNIIRLLVKTVKSLQIWAVVSQKNIEMNTIAASLRDHSLLKITLKELRAYKNNRQ